MTEIERKWFHELQNIRKKAVDTLEMPFMRGVKKSIIEKYSDQAHFIYELIQNADDVGATKVDFILYSDKLVFIHNGTKRFTLSDPLNEEIDQSNNSLGDINSITSIAQSTKSGKSIQKIGKFGVGFKAVFQYTSSPEIYDENFKINITDLIYPNEIFKDFKDRKKHETVFVFPFNHQERTPKESYSDISEKLQKLKHPNLFLNSIEVINYKIVNSISGKYTKIVTDEDDFENLNVKKLILTSEIGNRIENTKLWLFSRCDNIDPFYSVGFLLDDFDKLVPYKNQSAFCYFPTKEVTNLNFIIHAPFLLNDSREGIVAGNGHNKVFIDRLSRLVSDAFIYMRDLGIKNNMRYIDDTILDIIPYDKELFTIGDSSKLSFLAFYNSIEELFSYESILPTKFGYTSKINAYLFDYSSFRRENKLYNMIDFFSDNQLKILVNNENAEWVFITKSREEIRTTNDALRKFLDLITENFMSDEKIINRLDDNYISKQTIQDLHNLYFFIGSTSQRIKSVRNRPILLNHESKPTIPFDNKGNLNIFLPTLVQGYNTVLSDLLENDETKVFLKELGVEKPQIKDEVFSKIIPNLRTNNYDTNMSDFTKVFEFYKKASQNEIKDLVEELKDISFIRCSTKESANIMFLRGSNIYFKTEILNKFSKYKKNYPFLRIDDYTNLVSNQDVNLLNDFFLKLGVNKEPRIIRNKVNEEYKARKRYETSYWNQSTDFWNTHWLDYHLDGAEEVINGIERNEDIDLSIVFWNFLNKLSVINTDLSEVFWGRYKYFYRTHKELKFENTPFIRILKTRCWILNNYDEFVSTKCVSLKTLSKKYEISSLNEVYPLLKFLSIQEGSDSLNEDITNNLTDSQKKKINIANIIINAGISEEDVIRIAEKEKRKTEFPTNVTINPIRRAGKIAKETIDAKIKSYQEKIRSVRVTQPNSLPSTTLRTEYTNDFGQMICQICQNEMPFKKRDNQYYFESVELFEGMENQKEHERLYIALCPICSAKYKEYVKYPKKTYLIMESIFNFDISKSNSNFSIPIHLDQPSNLRFTEKHFFDIRTILKTIKS